MRRSGSHEELQRANGEADEDAEAGQGGEGEKKKKISRVFRYAFMMPHDNNVTAPMFVIGYQELYNTALTEVTAIRIWKFVRCARTLTHSLHTPYSRSAMFSPSDMRLCGPNLETAISRPPHICPSLHRFMCPVQNLHWLPYNTHT